MGKKLSNAPVFFTIVQVQFNPILNLETFMPLIQAKMREMHFPDYKEEISQRVILPFGGDQLQAAPTLTAEKRFIFGDIKARNIFILSNNSITLQTSCYEDFDAFSSKFINCIGMLKDFLPLDFYERIGLRYLDAIQPEEGESYPDYLVPEVLGLSMNIKGTLEHSISETVSNDDDALLISRVVFRNAPFSLPNELLGHTPIIDKKFTKINGTHAIIDIDSVVSNRDYFDIVNITKKMNVLHENVAESFNTIITPYALSKWA
ncbi:TPA: TIGR04255 family protein [Aeromonas hydrophila]